MEALAGPVAEGNRALESADWVAARAAFESALGAPASARADLAAAHDGLGLALWFLGDIDAGIARRELAVPLLSDAGRPDDAARTAVWVSHQHVLAGRVSAARGWQARAERCLDGTSAGVGHGWVAVGRGRHAVTVAEQIAHASRALAIARRHHADDLEVFALSLLGRAELAAGHRHPGLALLEEAMTAATAGRVSNPHTLAEAYCNLVLATTHAGEWELAAEWCRLVEEFARTRAMAPLFGACRTAHADVLLATGHWPEAEQALESALAAQPPQLPELGAPTVASLAELRVRQGRLADAEALLAGREQHPTALRALALLRVAEGRPAEAASLLERGLGGGEDPIRMTQLLAALVDARLAQGRLGEARAAADRLDALAGTAELRLVSARADLARARVAAVEGHREVVQARAGSALASFLLLTMPLDAAEARLELARALATTEPALAADEARTALAVFRSLGAELDREAAAALLRSLTGHGVGTAASPRTGGLTAREAEVLDLVARGLSNARIAQTLVISEKTAAHHVSRILAKLGVRNRTEAAARVRQE